MPDAPEKKKRELPESFRRNMEAVKRGERPQKKTGSTQRGSSRKK